MGVLGFTNVDRSRRSASLNKIPAYLFLGGSASFHPLQSNGAFFPVQVPSLLCSKIFSSHRSKVSLFLFIFSGFFFY